MKRELDKLTSGTDLAVAASVFASRSSDSSRTDESRSVIFTTLLETVAVDSREPLLPLKMELEVGVNADWLEATVVASGMEDCG